MIRFIDACIPMGRDRRLKVRDWTLLPGEVWVITGPGGSGKTTLARAIARPGTIAGMEWSMNPNPGAAWISFEVEQEIRDLIRRNDDSEYLGKPDEGTDLESFLAGSLPGEVSADTPDSGVPDSGVPRPDLPNLLDDDLHRRLSGRGVRNLSTGEFRQVLIAREARRNPPLAVLDEPFEGLDADARPRLMKQLKLWAESGVLIVLTINRLEDLPTFAAGLAVLKDDDSVAAGPPGDLLNSSTAGLQSPEITVRGGEWNRKTKAVETPPPVTGIVGKVPPPPEFLRYPGYTGLAGDVLIQLTGVSLAFNGRRVLEDVNWKIVSGESWLLTGPNGSGKTTLLNLISGDEPRGYGQNIHLFGRRKGSGETTAEIKSYIGHVSSALQEMAPRHSNPMEIIGSGLKDSMVLTGPLDGFETDLVEKWLELLNLEKCKKTPFFRLSYGERRMVMIGRAMVKHPPLLLLDEPMHGLDDRSRKSVSNLVDLLVSDTGTSVLFVSHRPEDAPFSIVRHIQLVPSGEAGPSRAVTGFRVIQPGISPTPPST